MDIREAELIFDAGKEVVVKPLLEMHARIESLSQQVVTLEKKIASLSTNWTNSSKPPSSDGSKVVKPKKRKSSRSPGGQKRHIGHKRGLLPLEQMDHVHECYPEVREKCAASLNPQSCEEISEPSRYQTFELPEIKPIMTEYRWHELKCTCGHKTRAEIPSEVAPSQFGPRVHGAIGYLSSVHRIGRRGIVEILNTLFGLNLCVGTVCNSIERLSPELEIVSEEVRQVLADAPHLHIDETGWKCKGLRRYLWVFVCRLAIYFTISTSRGSKVLRSTLGDSYRGVIISDDHSAYSCYHKNGLRQLCWSPLIRKFKGLKDRGSSPDAQVRTRARRTLKNWPHLFTFLFHEGVEPANNPAELGLRPAVQWRKLCFGNQSEAGERFTERILTVTRTCQLRGKNPFHFLSELMYAVFKGFPRPSLVD
jgi:transposase